MRKVLGPQLPQASLPASTSGYGAASPPMDLAQWLSHPQHLHPCAWPSGFPTLHSESQSPAEQGAFSALWEHNDSVSDDWG